MGAEIDMGQVESRRHHEATLAGLYEEYYSKIARYVLVRIGNRTEAEDLAGEVFLRALDSLRLYEERGIPMQAWLFRIAHNLVVDHLRKRAKHRTVPIDTLQIESDMSPATIAEKNIEFEKVKKAMEQLTPAQKKVIGLRFFSGLTSGEVGQILNKSDGAVREMQRAAIESLRKLLAKSTSFGD